MRRQEGGKKERQEPSDGTREEEREDGHVEGGDRKGRELRKDCTACL